jgi:hypothetical protein
MKTFCYLQNSLQGAAALISSMHPGDSLFLLYIEIIMVKIELAMPSNISKNKCGLHPGLSGAVLLVCSDR